MSASAFILPSEAIKKLREFLTNTHTRARAFYLGKKSFEYLPVSRPCASGL